MTASPAPPSGSRRTDLVWGIVAAVAALVLLAWGLMWVGDIRFTGPKREAAAKVVVVGGAIAFLVAELIRRRWRLLGLAAYAAVVVGVPLALFVVVDRAQGTLSAGERRPTATAAELPTPVPLLARTGDDVREIDVAIGLTEFATGLAAPMDAVFLDDGTMLVAERAGRIVSVSADGVVADEPVADLTAETTLEGERGLQGITLSPSGRLYAHLTDVAGDNLVVSWELDGLVADPDSRLEVLGVEQTKDNHNGGGIAFGPDGALYVAIGDGGGVGDPKDNAQASWNRLGSILRVIPDEVDGGYLIPPDNPWVDDDEIWPETVAYGLRNPLRMRFDAVTGDLWIGDVGDANFEEVNLIPAGEFGQNFGWNRLEADQVFSGSARLPTGFDESDIPEPNTLPAYFYAHDKSAIPDVESGVHPWRNSITGGVRYRGTEIPDLYGVYLHADFAANTIGGVAFDDDLTAVDDVVFDLVPDQGVEFAVPVSIVEDRDHEVYIVSLGGVVYRLTAAP